MSKFRDEFLAHLEPLADPYLFVGSGLSQRVAGLPTWSALLAHFAEEVGKPFDYYKSGADGDLPRAATLLARDFRELWFADKKYKGSRGEWDGKVDTFSMPLKIEAANWLHGLEEAAKPSEESQQELDLLAKATINGVITTNYDQILQKTFPDFRTYLGQDGLIFSDTQGIAEIYAIHGATTHPATMVLTAEDYQHFDERQAYLAAKLLTTFVEHPVVFLGYSLGDSNVQSILRSLVRGLTSENLGRLRDRLVFVNWNPASAPTISDTQMTIEQQVLPLKLVTVPDFIDVFSALGERQHALPARTLRYLKEQVYEIVKTHDPKGRIYAYEDIDAETAERASLVFGVGAKFAEVGVVGLKPDDLIRDVLDTKPSPYPHELLLKDLVRTFPNNWYCPVFLYLREANLVDAQGGLIDDHGLPNSVVERVANTKAQFLVDGPAKDRKTMADIEANTGWQQVYYHFNTLGRRLRQDDVEAFKEFLLRTKSQLPTNAYWPSQFRKGVVLYDYLRNGLGWE